MSERDYENLAGFVAKRKNRLIGRNVVALYVAAEQGIDVGTDKYAAVCEEHGNIGGFATQRQAIPWLAEPEFCEDCVAEFVKNGGW
jgi:hypothetical protein